MSSAYRDNFNYPRSYVLVVMVKIKTCAEEGCKNSYTPDKVNGELYCVIHGEGECNV